MKIKQFDVVELKDNNKAIIKSKKKRNNYLVELINEQETRIINDKDIKHIIYSRKKER
jgi:hypothetical protein